MTSAPALIVGLLLALEADPAKTAAEVKRFREANWTEVRRLADILPVFDRSGETARAVLQARGGPGKHDDVRGWKVEAADLRGALGTPELEVDRRVDWTYL